MPVSPLAAIDWSNLGATILAFCQNILLPILYTVIIFGVIIFIHELGHFIVARLCKVTVNEFSLGMGPAVWKHQGKKTLYSLRIFPIGGFCAMEGEDAAGAGSVELPGGGDAVRPEGEEEENEDPNAFNKKPVLARMAISAAGPFMNVLLGFLIILSTFAGAKYYTSTQVADFKENATSSQTGLQAGDWIVRMNGAHIFSDRDIVFEALRDDDGIIDMVVVRGDETVELPGVTFTVSGEGEERSLYLDFRVTALQPSFLGAFEQAGRQTISLARNAVASVGDLITGRIGFSELSGPVGVGQVVGQAAKIGWSSILSLAAFISISIGIFNLLPFPALDGGRILFLLIEGVRRKPINPKWEGYINAAGLILLFLLMIVVTFKDILNLF